MIHSVKSFSNIMSFHKPEGGRKSPVDVSKVKRGVRREREEPGEAGGDFPQ